MFIDSFFKSRENVNKIKEHFVDRIELYLVEKDFTNDVKKTYFNIDKVENYLKISYTEKDLQERLE